MAKQFEISGGIATRLWTKINSSDQLARTDQVDAGGALPAHLTGDAWRLIEPATIRFTQPDLHPARADSVADRVRESRQQFVELGRLLHRRAEVLE